MEYLFHHSAKSLISSPMAHAAYPDWPGRPAFEAGSVWLVGAGPGDPGLLTLQALAALSEADAVVHDALVDARVLGWVRPGAVVEDMGKRAGRPSPRQPEITARLVAHARAGRRVVRLKGGDPFVFGRGAEEAEALTAAGVPVRVVPGVTAGIGGLAAAGIPATHRDVNQAVTFVTGHDRTGRLPPGLDWAALAKGSPVLVLYMAVRTLPAIAQALMAAGRQGSEPVAVVMNATRPDQRVLESTLARVGAEMARAGIGAPAVVCVGEVVSHRRLIGWAGEVAGAPPLETA